MNEEDSTRARRRRRRRRRKVYSKLTQEEEKEEESLFKADAVNEEDSENNKADGQSLDLLWVRLRRAPSPSSACQRNNTAIRFAFAGILQWPEEQSRSGGGQRRR